MDGHKIINQNGLHFLTFTVVGWLDIFSRIDYRDIIIESFGYCQKEKGLDLYAYVIMTNHIHVIVAARDGYQLSDIIRDFKKYTSKVIIKRVLENSKESRQEWMLRLFKYFGKHNKNNKLYQFWQRTNYPIELVSPKWINQKLNYIHNNPVRAGIVSEPEHYLYSSASNYLTGEGLIDLKIISLDANQGYVFMG